MNNNINESAFPWTCTVDGYTSAKSGMSKKEYAVIEFVKGMLSRVEQEEGRLMEPFRLWKKDHRESLIDGCIDLANELFEKLDKNGAQ